MEYVQSVKSVRDSVSQSVSWCVIQLLSSLVGQSVNQTVSQPASQLARQPASQPASQSVSGGSYILFHIPWNPFYNIPSQHTFLPNQHMVCLDVEEYKSLLLTKMRNFGIVLRCNILFHKTLGEHWNLHKSQMVSGKTRYLQLLSKAKGTAAATDSPLS